MGPNISNPIWHRSEHNYKDSSHIFTLNDLTPNAEYAYRIVISENNDWTNSTVSPFDWFTTKTEPCSVSVISPEDGSEVENISNVVVRASDSTYARFSPHGIVKVELLVDGVAADEYDKATGIDESGSSYVDYTFNVDSLNLTDGVHQIDVRAYDDYWRITYCHARVLISASGTMLSEMISTQTVNATLATTSNNTSVSKEVRKSQVEPPILSYAYWDGMPRQDGGSIGNVYLFVNGLLKGLWPATSGLYKDERHSSACGTCPAGDWKIDYDGRISPGGKNLGAWCFGMHPQDVHNMEHGLYPQKPRDHHLIRTHGKWNGYRGTGKKPYSNSKEELWTRSLGCIMLIDKDMLSLRDLIREYKKTARNILIDVYYDYNSAQLPRQKHECHHCR